MSVKRTAAVAKKAASGQPLADADANNKAAQATQTAASEKDEPSEELQQETTDQTEAPEAEQSTERVRVCVLNHSGHALTVKGVTEPLKDLLLPLPPCGKSDSIEIDALYLLDMEEAVSFTQTSNCLRPGAVQLHIEKAIK